MYSCVTAPIRGEGPGHELRSTRVGVVGSLERSSDCLDRLPTPKLLLAAATAAARCSANNTDAPKTTFTSEYHIWVLTRIPDVLEAPVPSF